MQAIYQRTRGLQVQCRLGQKCTGQGTAISLGLSNATPLCVAPISVDCQLDMREFKSSDDLFELWGEALVIKLYQTNEFALQSDKSLSGNWTQGSIHRRAPSSDFDTLIFQPFRRCPQLLFCLKQQLIRLA